MTRIGAAAACLVLALPSLAAAQAPDSLPGLARLRLRQDTLRIVPPPAFEGAGRLAYPRRAPEALATAWAEVARRHAAEFAARRQLAYRLGDTTVYQAPPEAQQNQVAIEPPDAGQNRRGVQFLGQYADLGIQLNALLETRFEQRRNLRCTAFDAGSFDNGCRGGFTPPRLEPQFNVRTGGVVGQRVHVNIDYDTQREFDASNNVQVSYEGLEDEILRRVDVGNVTFQAPRSRFITGGIPANNFGVAASAQVGAFSLGGLFAQQKGNVAKARVFSVGGQTVIPVDRTMADRDFEPQRFFFVRDPHLIDPVRYPAIDVLDLLAKGIPDSVRVTQVRIYRHRSTIGRSTTETNLTGIQAVALRGDSPQRAGPIAWEVLTPDRDYYLDPSGLWFALVSRLDQEDFLAVSYVTAAGDTVGTFPAAAVPGRSDTLELIYAPRTGADVPTFFYEMRNVYRVGSADDISRASVALELLVGGSARPPGNNAPTFLSLLGLAQTTDSTTFDQYNRLFPRLRDPNAGAPIRDFFVVLPHLAPFASDTLPPAFQTDSLYRTPGYLLRTQGPTPLWQLNLHYDAKGGDNRGNLILGGYQIRAGSERVMANNRQLIRNVDYTINYEVGQLTFLHPDSLFPQATQVSVQFEENQAFAVAPTSIYGMSAVYNLGDHGTVSALGLYQTQRTTFTRPPLGFEPASNFVAGITGNFLFEPQRLTRLLDALPMVRTEAPSLVTLDAEIATSRPSPNRTGVAYVETFENEAGFFLPLGENQWEFGSRPGSPHGAEPLGISPTGFDDNDAVLMTWQNLIPAGSSGNNTFQLRSSDIDSSIVLQGSGQQYETVLWMALHPDTIGGRPDPRTFGERWKLPHSPGPRWRSMTQPLSATGIDLSRTEYLEFWVLEDTLFKGRSAGLSVVFDFGSVFEDAVDFQPTAFTTSGADTTYTGRKRAGEGRLDTERDTLTATFNAQIDDNGILGDVADTIFNATTSQNVLRMPICQSQLATGLVTYSWGSPRTHCTRRNGSVDTEDLNNDQHLDTLIAASSEDAFRYVFRLGDPRYLVRDGGSIRGLGRWHLYRIPFRSDSLQVGTPDIRQVRALRMTVVAPGSAAPESTLFFAMARMRLVGAPWIKRAGSPIAGLGGQQGQPHGEVIASVISTENRNDLGYEPPPGVRDQGATLGSNVGSTQINERSLRIVAVGLQPNERAEAFYRFPEGDRNFMGYRQLRVWGRGRGADWDRNELSFFVKVGQDENNFYLYRQHLKTTDWLPEAVVDFTVWNALRAQVEQSFLAGQPPNGAAACGGDTLAYVACSADRRYVVQVRNPSISPPNLTRVQELAVGFIRDSGSALDSTELWVDDIRLSDVVRDPGYAGAVNLNIAAADVINLNLSASTRDGNFRQLGENPSYNGTSQVGVVSTVRLERFGFDRLGLTVPLSLRYDRTSEQPYFLSGTDVLASGLSDLRAPVTRSASWSVSVRRTRRGTQWWQRALTDNLGFSAASSNGSSVASLGTSTSRLSNLHADYAVAPSERSVRYLPGFLRSLLDALPPFLRRSDAVKGLQNGRLRLTPAALTFSSDLVRTRADRASFRVPIPTPTDTAITARSTTALFRTTAGLELRPFTSMSLGATASWDRDLRDYGTATPVARLASEARGDFLGMNVGFVRQRALSTRFAWQPPIASWVRPTMSWNTTFNLSRDPTSVQPESTLNDTTLRIPTTFANAAGVDLSATFDLSRMWRGAFGDSAGVLRIIDRITQLDIGRRVDRRSQFNRAGFDPGTNYLLGFGGQSAFRAQNGTFAISASDLTQDRAAIAVRLPLSLNVQSAYARRTTLTWFERGDGQQLQKGVEAEWPSVSARWLWTPGPAIRKFIVSLNASIGYSERSATTETPGLDLAGGTRSRQETRSLPITMSISWAPRLTTTLGIANDRSRAERTGNSTLGERRNASASANFSFRPPQSIVKLRSDVRTALRFTKAVNSLCATLASGPECIRIADSRQTEYNLTMDTDFPPAVVAGLSAGYVLTDDRHLNRKFSLFTLTASARIFFSAGELR